MKGFQAWRVNTRGLSRKEAAKKIKFARAMYMAHADIKEVVADETSRDKCKYKCHVSRAYVRENMDKI